ncbi:MAG: RDD family protein [Thiomargarita sp.]|nr:RDD family protein [Thiomargarita sp.]
MTTKINSSFVEYVGFWKRMMAALIDLCWIVPVITLLCYGLYLVESNGDLGLFEFEGQKFLLQHAWQAFLIINILPALLIILFWAIYGSTPGKLLFDSKIVDADSREPIKFKQMLIRYASYLLSIFPFFLGFFWILFDKRKQGWHDKIAKTVIIKNKKA